MNAYNSHPALVCQLSADEVAHIKAQLVKKQALMDAYDFDYPINLTPKTAQGVGLMNLLTDKQYQMLRLVCLKRSNCCCTACGSKHGLDGKGLYLHEFWDWNAQTCEQRLIRVIPLCESCNHAMHWSYANRIGCFSKALDHYLTINGKTLSRLQLDSLLDLVYEIYHLRSKLVWQVNIERQLQWLKEVCKV